MLTSEQIREKIYALADDFERYYAQKEYARAKYAYDTASTMAVFMELPQEDIYELFMNHNPSDDKDAEPVWGRFDRDKAHECFLYCMRRNMTYNQQPYHGPRAPGSKELVV